MTGDISLEADPDVPQKGQAGRRLVRHLCQHVCPLPGGLQSACVHRDSPDRAGTSITFAAKSDYASVLYDALTPENVAAAADHPGWSPETEHSSPEILADRLYDIHHMRDGFRY